MMMDNGISLADIAAVTRNDEMNGMNGVEWKGTVG